MHSYLNELRCSWCQRDAMCREILMSNRHCRCVFLCTNLCKRATCPHTIFYMIDWKFAAKCIKRERKKWCEKVEHVSYKWTKALNRQMDNWVPCGGGKKCTQSILNRLDYAEACGEMKKCHGANQFNVIHFFSSNSFHSKVIPMPCCNSCSITLLCVKYWFVKNKVYQMSKNDKCLKVIPSSFLVNFYSLLFRVIHSNSGDSRQFDMILFHSKDNLSTGVLPMLVRDCQCS